MHIKAPNTDTHINTHYFEDIFKVTGENNIYGIFARKPPQIRTAERRKCHFTYCTPYCTLTACTIRCFSSTYFQYSRTVEEWGRTKGKFCISQQCPEAGLLACLAQLPDSVHLFLLPTAGGQSTVCCSIAGRRRSANLLVIVCSAPIKAGFSKNRCHELIRWN